MRDEERQHRERCTADAAHRTAADRSPVSHEIRSFLGIRSAVAAGHAGDPVGAATAPRGLARSDITDDPAEHFGDGGAPPVAPI